MFLTLRSVVTLLFMAAASVAVQADGSMPEQLKVLKTQIQEATYKENIEEIASIRDALKEFLSTSTESEKHWGYYYAALANYRLASLQQDKISEKEKDKLLSQSVEWLDQSISHDKNFAEAYALKSSALGLMIDGMFEGMRLGKTASNAMEKAYELAPDNPRVIMLDGIGKLYTPSMFGGGADNALEKFKKAEEKFHEQSRDGPVNWGQAEIYGWLAEAYLEKGNKTAAAQAIEQGLTIAPSFKWLLETKAKRLTKS